MKLFKNTKVKMASQPVEVALEKLSGILYEDERVIGYYENKKKKLAFTDKRIIFVINDKAEPNCLYYSYRNIAAYGVKKGCINYKLQLGLINSPEYASLTLKVKKAKREKNEDGSEIITEDDPGVKLQELCRFMGNLVW